MAFALTPEWMAKYHAIACRRFGNEGLAEEAVTSAIESLSANDWSALSKYNQRSSPDTYLITVFNNALEDFSRRRFGRVRPPVWLKRLGGVWVKIFQMLCLEREDPESIVARLTGSLRSTLDAEQIHCSISQIRGRIPDCGAYRMEETTNEEGLLDTYSTNGSEFSATPDASLEGKDQATILSVLADLLGKVDVMTVDEQFKDRLLHVEIKAAIISAKLNDDDRLVLKLVFQEGYGVAEVARLQKIPDHHVRRRLQKVLKRMKKALNDRKLSANDILIKGD